MSLSLTIGDQRRLTHALGTLLRPLDFESVDGWRAAVTRSIKPLIDADMATFQLPVAGGRTFYTEDVDAELVNARYVPLADPIHRKFQLWHKQVELGVWNRSVLFGPHIRTLYQSAYYEEFLLPLRAYDSIGLTVPLPTFPDATLYFHHESPHGRRFGRRGLSLLRLLRDAFSAGVTLQLSMAAQRSSLVRVLDEVSDAVLLFSSELRLVHANPAALEVLRADPGGELKQQVEDVARTVRSASCVALVASTVERGKIAREVCVGGITYRMVGTLVGADIFTTETSILVNVQRVTPRLPSRDQLQMRFGLTRKEGEVALLLAKGKTLDEVALQVHASRHTIRHHTENIMRKLNVHSRAELVPALLRISAN